MSWAKPIIERFYEDIPIDEHRREAAEVICNYHEGTIWYPRDKYLDALSYILRTPEFERFILYIPFEELYGAPQCFKDLYREAWFKLLSRYDVRENFHEGDTLEEDARPNGILERVVKCVHLIPWLLEAKYLDFSEIIDIIRKNRDDLILVQSFKDTLPYITHKNFLSKEQIHEFQHETAHIPPRVKVSPLYVSSMRIKWLEERNRISVDLATPKARLQGPFSPNAGEICKKIALTLEPDDVVLMGGSRLKGYAATYSDFDIWKLKDLEKSELFYPGSVHAIHMYFNSIWLGGENIKDVGEVAKSVLNIYSNNSNRRELLERLESDLLQYRLLHKGFSRFTGKRNFATLQYPEMDGDCPFYDREYRKIATMLYVKYILLP